MNKYNVRKNGKFVKLRRGSLYKVNGVTSRYRGQTEEGKYRFTVHKIFNADLPTLNEARVELVSKADVNSYLS